MKRFLLAAGAWLVLTVLSTALRAADDAPQRPGALDPVKMVQNLHDATNAMDLSDDQKAKIASILDRADEQAKSLQDKIANLSPREKLAQIGPFIKDVRDQLSQVLNPDQLKALVAKLNLPPRAGGAGPALTILQDSLAKLDLSDDQKKQVDDALRDVRQKAQDIREKAVSGQDVRDDVQQIRQEAMQKLGGILTPDQQQKLREMVRQAGRAPADAPVDKPKEMTTSDGMAPAKPADKGNAGAKAKDDKDLTAAAGPDLGSAAPDIQIEIAPGHPAALSSFKGHMVVIELGSLSCPTFRDHAADIEKVKTDIGMGAYFTLVYTREAFPAGDKQIERNKKDQMEIEQPADSAARKSLAQRAIATLHISLPLTVDDMDDHLASALGGFPNGCIIIGKDGKIAGRQRWIEPAALKRMIEEAQK